MPVAVVGTDIIFVFVVIRNQSGNQAFKLVQSRGCVFCVMSCYLQYEYNNVDFANNAVLLYQYENSTGGLLSQVFFFLPS